MDSRVPTLRLRNAAAVVPLLGALLLLPPLIALFTAPVKVFGIPLIVLYMFVLWGALIAAAFWLAGRLGTPAHPAAPEQAGDAQVPPTPPPA